MTPTTGVAVMAYGTPASPDDLEAYYTHIRRGRPPTSEQLRALRVRYEAIGGVSPLLARTEAQRVAIQDALERLRPGRFVAVLGMKHAPPFVEDAVAALAAEGVSEIVGLVLSPHYSRTGIGGYHDRASAAASTADVEYVPIDSWYDEPSFVAFHAAAIEAKQRELAPDPHVLFTAHSLPERVLDGDPYPDQLAAGAAAIAAEAELGDDSWSLAWQSAGATPDQWRGPDVNEVVRALASAGRARAVLVCPHGFTADHLELLYDLDVVARATADDVGLHFARTAAMNDDPAVMTALAARVVAAVAS